MHVEDKTVGKKELKADHGIMRPRFDCLFGPAYKGIPLAAAVAVALYKNHGISAALIVFRQTTLIYAYTFTVHYIHNDYVIT